jgi:putative FmdB family regulatory protein
MPTYDYRCNSCAKEFEVFQRITAEPGANCPKCGGPARRLVSGGTGLIFKGSGFYITDYKHKGAEGEKWTASQKSDSSPEKPDSASAKSDSASAKSGSSPQKPEAAASSGEASGKTSAVLPSPAAPAPPCAPAAPSK